MSEKDDNFYALQNEEAKQHQIFQHYTNLEALSYILSDKSFRLSQLKKVNDPVEENRIDSLFKNKVFTLCFSHYEQETIPMWKMYANDKMGVCICFENLDFLENKNMYYRIEEGWEIRDAKLLDVLYVDNIEKYKIFDCVIEEDHPDLCRPNCIGFIKTKIWEYEQETRVRCYIDVAKGNPSRPINKFKKIFEYNYPNFDYVFCTIPEEVLHSIKIIFNPFMNQVQRTIVKSTVKNFLPDFEENNFINSRLEGQIR